MEDIKEKEEGQTVHINWLNLISAVGFLICAGLASSAQSACIFVGLSIFNLLFVVGQFSIDAQNVARENKKLLEEINGKLERLEKLEKLESIERNTKILRDDASEIQRKLGIEHPVFTD